MEVRYVTMNSAIVTSQRVEVRFVVTTDDNATEPFCMHASHKKHLVESYQSNDGYTPQVGQGNNHTMVRQTETEFLAAFVAYFEFLAAAIHRDGKTLAPSAPQYEFDTGKGYSFHSDCGVLGKDVHCYPSRAAAGSRNAAALPPTDFADFIKVLRFVWSAGERTGVAQAKLVTNASVMTSKLAEAKSAHTRIRTKPWYALLTTELERKAIQLKLSNEAGAVQTNKQVAQKMVHQPANKPFKPGT